MTIANQDSCVQEKKKLREHYLTLRAALSTEEIAQKSEELSLQLIRWFKARKQVHQVFLFAGFGQEPRLDTLTLYLSGRIPMALPVCLPDGRMDFFSWHLDDSLTTNGWGIPEPRSKGRAALLPDAHTVMLVPCLSADRHGHRLGYGKGFYDRYVRESKIRPYTCGIVWPEHIHPSALPADAHDLCLDHLVSPA
jgi:5-formyltetrahydrofolate cyclo-ligase